MISPMVSIAPQLDAPGLTMVLKSRCIRFETVPGSFRAMTADAFPRISAVL